MDKYNKVRTFTSLLLLNLLHNMVNYFKNMLQVETKTGIVEFVHNFRHLNSSKIYVQHKEYREEWKLQVKKKDAFPLKAHILITFNIIFCLSRQHSKSNSDFVGTFRGVDGKRIKTAILSVSCLILNFTGIM